MKINNVNHGPKPAGSESPPRPGIEAEDEAEVEAAEEAIDLMQAVEHPGEFSPPPSKRPKRKN
ncbi:MAG: hypothetical protein FJX54_21645 [Alphaproteobacteria bacterium]|nr:hypothetical protein [Alphaproteobacteria bacterium]